MSSCQLAKQPSLVPLLWACGVVPHSLQVFVADSKRKMQSSLLMFSRFDMPGGSQGSVECVGSGPILHQTRGFVSKGFAQMRWSYQPSAERTLSHEPLVPGTASGRILSLPHLEEMGDGRNAKELQTATLLQEWRALKAAADRLWWQMHKDRINARRRSRYRHDAVYRRKQQERARQRQQQKPAIDQQSPSSVQ